MRAVKEGNAGPEATSVEKQTTETLMAGERIAEALEISEEDRLTLDVFESSKKNMDAGQIRRLAPRPRNAVFSIYSADIEPELHVLKVVQKIPPASLNDALLVLPFARVVSMLNHLDFWVKKVGKNCFLPGLMRGVAAVADSPKQFQKLSIPLSSRILFFLVKTHYSQIVATRLMRTTMLHLREHLSEALDEQKVFHIAFLNGIDLELTFKLTGHYWIQCGSFTAGQETAKDKQD